MSEPPLTLVSALRNRYVVERELGRGGMATVYLARDLKHDRLIALKVLYPNLTTVLGPERFLREIRLAARLQHPHILTVHDSGADDGHLWYTMPYLDGESLQYRLAREKQLSIEEAVRITTEIGWALEYAHGQAIIHREVKPGNILFSNGQAILGDFGIARAITAATDEELTQSGLALGTPVYMSPEQATGGPGVDARTDIYSLGCVLYEMLAGDPPFTGSTAQMVLARKSAEPPPTLRTVRDTVPEALDQVVRKAIARIPADRFSTARLFVDALARPGTLLPPPRKWRSRAAAVAGLSLLILAAVLLLPRLGRNQRPSLDARRVLVTPFENRTGDVSLDPVGEIAVDWLIRELQSTELVQVIDQRSLVARGGDTESASAGRPGRKAGAGTILSLAYYRLGDSLRFQARVTEPGTGARLYMSDPQTAALASPLQGFDYLSQSVVNAIVTLIAPGVEWRAGKDRPPSFAAYREFMAGMALLPPLDFNGAMQHWFRAARLDTNFVTPLLSAASFMLVSGQNARADSLLSSIRGREERIRASERLRLSNLRARLRGNIPEATAALRPLAQSAPLSELAWELALHELWLNRPQEAIPVFQQLNPRSEFLQGWWFYWTFYCNAYHLLGDYGSELTVAKQGRAQYPNSIRVAEPEIGALAALGRIEELKDLLEEVSGMPSEEKGDLARALTVASQELRAHGHTDLAAAVLKRAGTAWENRSGPVGPAEDRWLPAMLSHASEQWDEAGRRFTELAIRDSADVNVQGHLGAIAARRGDRGKALRIAKWLETLDRPYLYGYNTLWRARIAALLGDREDAVDLLRAAFGEGLKHVGTFLTDSPARTYGPWLHRDLDLESLRDSPRFQQVIKAQG